MGTIRLAVIGCGAIALHGHFPAIGKVPGGKLVAVVDSDPKWVQQVARRFGAKQALTDYRELAGMVDAAIVATPNWTHAEITCNLLERGIHILCEKPMAISVTEAQSMFAAAERSGARLMAAHSRRFTRNAKALRALVKLGSLGDVLSMRAALGGPASDWPAREAFRKAPRLSGGGCLLDTGVHLIDLAIWLMGDRVDILRYESRETMGWGVEDDANLSLRFTTGAIANLACSYTRGLDGVVHILGTQGWAMMPLNGIPAMEFFAKSTVVGRSDGVQQIAADEGSPYERQLQHFCSCLQTGEPFSVTADEVLASLRIVEECYERGAGHGS